MEREEMIERFIQFFKEYTEEGEEPLYLGKINDLLTVTPKRSVTINWMHLNSYDPELASYVLEHPEDSIGAAEDAIQIILKEEFLREDVPKIHARFHNLPETLLVKDIGAEHINKLIQVEGVITRVTEIKPYVSVAVFVCKDCGHEMVVKQRPYEGFTVVKKCEQCGSKNVQLDVDKSSFVNFQMFRIQDRPETLKGGQMPRFIDGILLDDIVDTAMPGDRVLVTGILRVVQERREKTPVFRKILEVNHIEPVSKEIEELEITPEDEQKIRELSQRKDIVDAIVDSIAPAIYGYREVKKGIALALFGGVPRVLPDGTRLRGDIHVLLVGDPGVAKSQLLRYVANLAPRAIYTSGKSSSAAGLTAAAVRDEFTGGWVLEAGALVLADGGYALIDELDKMSDRDRSVIHEALEQQSYHKDFELLLADGRKVKIGEFVDKLMEENKDKIIHGKDTEILPVDNIYVLAYNLDEKKIVRVKADRVSRHTAPDHFIRLRFSNGREVMVTPEHPIMVWEEGKVKEKPAEEVKEGDIALGVKSYTSLDNIQLRESLAKLVGFLLGSKANGEIKTNDYDVVNEVTELLREFDVEYKVETMESTNERTYIIRVDQTEIKNRLREELQEGFQKNESLNRIPAKIIGADKRAKHAFINGLFKVSGFVDKDNGSIGFLTHSRSIAEDLQDVLLSLGILSTIEEAKAESDLNYKVVISEKESIKRFIELVGYDSESEKLREAFEVSGDKNIESVEERENIHFLKVVKVEKVPNTDSRWVYDVTVEPYHLFVSHGLVLHNTISISKAGITATLNARTTVIAAANPKHGRFNRMKPFFEQIDLPPTLLSRFDLIFVLVDEPDEKTDSEIARHILRVRRGESEVVTPKIPHDLLRKYIAYAKKNVHPVISEEAMEEIEKYYVRMRRSAKRSSENEDIRPIPITARQLEALIRLSEAHARMRLSPIVTREDAREAIKLMEYTLRQIATDETGQIDVTILEVGQSARKLSKVERILDIIEKLEKTSEKGAHIDDILEEARKFGIEKQEAREIVEKLLERGQIYMPENGYYKTL
ncbi:LAGLIDADG family homing endonuclease [Pyrococcus sp. ST04]|uniref:LAGLIDADG family homing endonuclease n=1 Tax=Pyrococcus sp. ST04 TaxID=1183377 RepID=UPI0002605B63|nr:LAGLIDADG family homing endonuclease [Pyrococcus sp. ST04]AFK22266.1 putative MCM family protein [Pyrococcus sp. ST04]